METASLRALLESRMAQATQRDVQEEPLQSAIVRLAEEGAFLLQTGRHGWVRRRTTNLVHVSNWPAYAMEVHLAYAMEAAGLPTRSSVRLIPEDSSDVDLVHCHTNGISVNAECVFTREPEDYWQDRWDGAPGITFMQASYDADGEALLLRDIQNKLRLKTIRDEGGPRKFPHPDDTSVNLLIADVTQGPGFDPDWWDLRLLSLGQGSVDVVNRRHLLGLFETRNPYALEFDQEFAQNQYLRERVHGLIFLIDQSNWRSPLNPTYEGVCVLNPSLPLSQDQADAVTAFCRALSLLVSNWICEQYWVPA